MADTNRTLKVKLEGVQAMVDGMKALQKSLDGFQKRTANSGAKQLATDMEKAARAAEKLNLATRIDGGQSSSLRQWTRANRMADAAAKQRAQAFAKAFNSSANLQYMGIGAYNAAVGGANAIKMSSIMQGAKGQTYVPIGQWNQASAAATALANKTVMYGAGQKPTALPTVIPGASSAITGRTPLQQLNAQIGRLRVGAQLAGSGGGGGRMNGAMQMLSAGKALLSNPIVATALAAATAVITGLVAVGAALRKSSEEIANFGALKMLTGGSTGQTATLKEMFAQMGISGDHANIMAGRMSERIMTDPLAMGWASRMGVRFMHGPYGDPNSGEKIVKLLERLSGLKGSQRSQAAFALAGGRNGDYVAMMQYLQGNTASVRGTRRSVEAADRAAYGPAATGAAAEFNASWGLFTSSLSTFASSVMRPLIPVGTLLLQGFTHIISGASFFANKIGDVLQILSPANWLAMIAGIGPSIKDLVKDFLGLGDGKDANTQAIEENTVEMQKFGRTYFGGGARTRSAMPGGAAGDGERWSRSADRMGFRMGAL